VEVGWIRRLIIGVGLGGLERVFAWEYKVNRRDGR
jgi:hypothetical protein